MFDQAVERYLRKHEARGVISSIRKATRSDSYTPKRKHIRNVILHTHASSWSPEIVQEITSIALPYKPCMMQAMSDSSDSIGNSIHNRSSRARQSIDLYGIQGFKALILIHSILQEGPESVLDISPLRFWMESLVREAEWGRDPEREYNAELLGAKACDLGYGKLVAGYVRYLTGRISLVEKCGLKYNLGPRNTLSDETSFQDLDCPFTIDIKRALGQKIENLVNLLNSPNPICPDSVSIDMIGCRGLALSLLRKDSTAEPPNNIS